MQSRATCEVRTLESAAIVSPIAAVFTLHAVFGDSWWSEADTKFRRTFVDERRRRSSLSVRVESEIERSVQEVVGVVQRQSGRRWSASVDKACHARRDRAGRRARIFVSWPILFHSITIYIAKRVRTHQSACVSASEPVCMCLYLCARCSSARIAGFCGDESCTICFLVESSSCCKPLQWRLNRPANWDC